MARICKIYAVIAALFVSLSLNAQGSFSVKFTLVERGSDNPVSFATASLTSKGSEAPFKYVLTDEEGKGTLTKIPKGEYVFRAELLGYKTITQEIKLEGNLNMGEVAMKVDAKQLDAASVSAVGNPIIVKKDTVEYNASSFKVSDNAVLEDLLKKLPGVEVNSDGTVTANGETISKITIDGKTFFLDDPQLATKNIPANIVDKVKVVEKKSDQALFTGIDDGQEETIIDLSIRPGMMNGVFGNVMAGAGHDLPSTPDAEYLWTKEGWRYQGSGMAGRFTDKSQISVILNANNTNNRGFNDMASSMMQGMRGGRGGMGRGMGAFGGSGNGITSSWMGGLNGAFTLLDGDMSLAGNYLYNGSDRFVEEESSKVTYLDGGSSLVNDNSGYETNFSNGHRFGMRLDHKFSDNTSILFEPQFNFGNGNYVEYSDFSTLTRGTDGSESLTNEGYTDNTGVNKNWTASGRFLFRQRLGKPGRTISANIDYRFSNNDLQGFNRSLTRTFEEDVPSEELIDQRLDNNTKSSSLSGRLVYTEPLGKDFYMEANYQYSWSQSDAVKNVFTDEVLDMTYSSSILNRYINQRAGLTFSYQKESLHAHLGAALTPQNTHNETNGEIYDNKVLNWSPQARLDYEFNDNSFFRMSYDGRSSQPSTSQLMPVPDNTNPLAISLGNPDLKPYFNHNIRGMFRYNNRQTFTSVMAFVNGGFVQNVITNANWYDNAGVQYSIPVNGPSSGNASARVMVNSPLAKSDFSIFSMSNVNYNKSTSYVGKSSFDTSDYYDSETAEFDYYGFNNDFPDLGASDLFTTNNTRSVNFTQNLRLTYRNDVVELIAGGRTNLSKAWYTITTSNQKITWNNQVNGSVNWTLPWGMNLIADVNYNWYAGYTTPQDDEIIVNAEITQSIFKKKMTLALKAYDILDQAKNLYVSDTSNYHMETRNNTLGRYIIISLTYRFGKFNGGGHRRGPMGGGPGGPPPGRF